MKDLMVDIETLSVLPNAAIISIGARMFDLKTFELGPFFYERCDPISYSRGNYAIDFKTITWWLQQSEAARMEFANTQAPLGHVLSDFFLNVLKWNPERVWAMPPSFDLIILENAIRFELGDKLRPLWPYNSTRCVWTVCDLAGIKKEDRVQPEIAHNALSDCDAQIATLKKAYAVIKLPTLG